MAINLIKEEVRTMEVLCQKCRQAMVESDVIVPDIKPDIKKVLDVSGTVCITEKTIQQDKAFVQGMVKMTVLYAPDGETIGNIKSLTTTQEFSHTMDCRGAMPEMQLFAEAEPESFDYTLINSRKLNLRCVLAIGIKVSKPAILELATGVEDNEPVALKKETLRIMNETGNAESRIILREQLEMPSGKPTIGEILKITATPIPIELCMMENKAVLKGQVRICTLYSAEDETASIQFMEHMLPFTEIIDAEGSMEDMEGEVEYALQDMYWEAREDNDGEARILGIELVLSTSVRGSEIREVEVITDAYALNGELDITTKNHQLEQLLDKNTAEISLKDQAKIPPMLPQLKQVCDVSSTGKIDRITVENGQVTVYGTVQTSILYLSHDEDAPVSGFRHISEFSHSFPLANADNDTACDARLLVDHVSYTLSGDNSIELRMMLGLTVKSVKTGLTAIIEEMIPFEPENAAPIPCIVLYFVQPGDSLWAIAKRYHTTVESLKSLNKLECDTIYPGQQIKILSQNCIPA